MKFLPRGLTVVFKKTRWHARVQGMFEGYFGDIWRTFGGILEEKCRNLQEVKRRLEGNTEFLKTLSFNILIKKTL